MLATSCSANLNLKTATIYLGGPVTSQVQAEGIQTLNVKSIR